MKHRPGAAAPVSRETSHLPSPPLASSLSWPDPSPELRARLDVFATLLGRWNQRINLIGPNELPHLWPRHILQSLLLVPLIPAGTARAIDLGSGAGFPGLVLAIATGIPFTLVESDARKAAFLQEAIAATAASATVRPARIERVNLPPVPLITARALAPLPDLLALAAPLLAPGGVCLFPKGRTVADELTSARRLWQFSVESFAAPPDPRGGATSPDPRGVATSSDSRGVATPGDADSRILKMSEIARVRPLG